MAQRHDDDWPRRLGKPDRLLGVLQWADLDALWQRLRASAEGWYVGVAGQDLPGRPEAAADLLQRVADIDATLRREHRLAVCGIVYVDDLDDPRYVEVFDPVGLGGMCAHPGAPPRPRWVLSRSAPVPSQAVNSSDAPVPATARPGWWPRVKALALRR